MTMVEVSDYVIKLSHTRSEEDEQLCRRTRTLSHTGLLSIRATSDVVQETSTPKMRADMRPSGFDQFRRITNGLW